MIRLRSILENHDDDYCDDEQPPLPPWERGARDRVRELERRKEDDGRLVSV